MESQNFEDQKETSTGDQTNLNETILSAPAVAHHRPILIVLLLFFIAGCGFVFLTELNNRVTEEGVPLVDSEPLDTLVLVTSNFANTSFRIPVEWEQVPPESVEFPFSTATPWIVIKNDAQRCYIASLTGEFADDLEKRIGDGAEYRRVSFDYVYSAEHSFDIYGFSSTKDDENPPQGESQFDVINTYSEQTQSFYLWNKDGDSVSEECILSLKQLLGTVRNYYESVDLSTTTEGHLRIALLSNTALNNEFEYASRKLVWVLTLDSGETFEVLEIPKNYEMQFGSNVIVAGNKMYWINNNLDNETGRIVVFDPFNKTIEVLPNSEINEPMHSLYLHDGKLYFITGFCEKSCVGDLYSIEMPSGTPTRIGTGIQGEIEGFDKSTDTVWLSDGFMDAGCVDVTLYKYSLQRSVQTVHDSASGCVEFDENGNIISEAQTQEAFDVYDMLEEMFPKSIRQSVHVSGGELYVSDQSFNEEDILIRMYGQVSGSSF